MAKFLLALVIAWAAWWLWRGPKNRKARPIKPAPSRDEIEARAVLGVGADADLDEIRAAHRRLVSAVHPDRGGSEDLTRRINGARDVLLKRRD